jgi:GT2 family glycosyltransferase
MNEVLSSSGELPVVFVIIPVHNRWAHTHRCLIALRAQTYPRVAVVLVDDGSTDDTAARLKSEFPEVVSLSGDGELWWTGATNLGLRYALSKGGNWDYVLTLNNDTTADPGYLLQLVSTASHLPGHIIGSVSVRQEDRKTIVDGGVRINWFSAKHTRLSRGASISDYAQVPCLAVDVLPGRGTLFPLRVFRDIGLFDVAHLPHYGADYEFARRAFSHGYHLVVDYRAILYSDTSSTGITNEAGRISWLQLASSFFSRRSPYQMRSRWHFARLATPWYVFPVYFGMDMLRVITSAVRNQFDSHNPIKR